MPSPSNSLRRAQPLLGTLVEIKARGPAALLPAAVDAAFAAVGRVHALMSFHDEASDVARINAAGPDVAVGVDPQTYAVLVFARELGDLSGGAFDIATAAVLVGAGFLPRPEHGEMSSAAATFRDLELLAGHRVRWRRPGCIDLGGIAKGYAVDRAIAALHAHGIFSGVVNAGGDLRCFGDAQPIHVRAPDSPTALIPLGRLADRAIATSAGYFSGRGDGAARIDPLVDPKRRACVAWNESVSVVTAECMVADALTKVVRLAPEATPEILARFCAQAIVIDRQGIRSCGPLLLQEEPAHDFA